MRKVLTVGCLFSVIPLFAGNPAATAIAPVWTQPLMIFAMLVLAITSRQISRLR